MHLTHDIDELQHENRAFDLAPAGEGAEIAVLLMLRGHACRLENRVVSMLADEREGFVDEDTVVDRLNMHFADTPATKTMQKEEQGAGQAGESLQNRGFYGYRHRRGMFRLSHSGAGGPQVPGGAGKIVTRTK